MPPSASIEKKSAVINAALVEKLRDKLGEEALVRFIPFVQMYEFEALLFSDAKAFSAGIDKPDLQADFQKIRDSFPTPEHVNDSPHTAPSKRVCELVPGYEKPLLGSLAAIEIGLLKIREECHIFDAWVQQLEALAVTSS